MSIEDVVEILAIPLIGAVTDDENVVISTNQGEPLAGNDSRAGQAFLQICRRIEGEEVPISDFSREESFFSRISNFFKRSERGVI